jgi:hypothetical protein
MAGVFPAGAVPPGDHTRLLERSRDFLRQRPPVARNTVFGLQESMQKTMAVYHQALAEMNP